MHRVLRPRGGHRHAVGLGVLVAAAVRRLRVHLGAVAMAEHAHVLGVRHGSHFEQGIGHGVECEFGQQLLDASAMNAFGRMDGGLRDGR